LLKRRGLSYEEVFHGVFPAIKAAAHNFDPKHNSDAKYPDEYSSEDLRRLADLLEK
jgi:hypothetical protein